MASLSSKYLTESEFIVFKRLLWSALFIVLAFAATLALMLMFLGTGSVEKEQMLYRAVASRATFELGELFQGKHYCVVPGGIGNDPEFHLLDQQFPGLNVSRARPSDSQDDWFIVLVSDTTADINPISYTKANLENEEAICAANIAIVVDHERNVRALAK